MIAELRHKQFGQSSERRAVLDQLARLRRRAIGRLECRAES
jgi:hypothetical protein